MTTTPHPTATRRRWAGLAVLSASLLVVAMDMTVLNVALPDLAAHLHPTADQQLWILDIYSLVLAGLLIPMSALADRRGRRLILLTGFTVLGGASLLVLLAHTPAAVIAVRALLGAGGAMIMPTTLSMIRSLFPDPRERATALGVWASTSSLGMAAGPILGGLLLQHFTWHAAFLVNVPVMATALVAGAILLPEVRDPAPGPWDPLATAQAITGMATLVWAIKHLAKTGPTDPTGWAALAAALGVLTWFVLRCLHHPAPLLDVHLFTRRPFTAGTLAALTSMLAMAALLLLVAQWLQLVLGLSPFMAGVYLTPMAAGAVIVSPLAPRIADRIGTRTALSGGLATAGTGFALLFLAPPLIPVVLSSLLLLGCGAGALTIASAIIMSGTPAAKAGNAAAIEETAYDLGNVLGVAVLGSIAAALYRNHLDTAGLTGPTPAELNAARESLGAALETAQRTGTTELATRAGEAFTHALTRTGLLGALVMFAAAASVFALLPRTLDLHTQNH